MKPNSTFWACAGAALIIVAAGLIFLMYDGRIKRIEYKKGEIRILMTQATQMVMAANATLEQIDSTKQNLAFQADTLSLRAKALAATTRTPADKTLSASIVDERKALYGIDVRSLRTQVSEFESATKRVGVE